MKVDEVTELNDDDKPKDTEKQVESEDVGTSDMSMKVDEVTQLNDDDKLKDAEKQVESEDMTMNEMATCDMNMKAKVTELNQDDKPKDTENQVEGNCYRAKYRISGELFFGWPKVVRRQG